jgi:hypothetical protein
MTMYQPGDRVWLRTTREMLARLIDPDASSGVVLWLIEVEGGLRMLARGSVAAGGRWFESADRPADSRGDIGRGERKCAPALTLALGSPLTFGRRQCLGLPVHEDR